MGIGRLNLIAGSLLAVLGLAVAAAGPAIAPAFGIPDLPAPGGSGSEVPAEWRLVAFARMFGIVVFMSGAILLAIGEHLERARIRRFAAAVAGASALACLLAMAQQGAIWNTTTGAAVATFFGVIALAYGWIAVRGERSVRELGAKASAVAAGNVH